MAKEDRWPPVYDAEDLVREIEALAGRSDLTRSFYEWRRDQSTSVVLDVCQGDVVSLEAEVPVIDEDGQPATMDHPEGLWLVIGNTCDFARDLEEARWTQLVPIVHVGTRDSLTQSELAALQKYTQSRKFHVPAWSTERQRDVFVADLLTPVAVDKRVLQGRAPRGLVLARASRAAWVLLNACLVRFLARDDGRYD